VVADVLVEQVIADHADGNLFDAGWIILQLLGVANLDLEQVVARGRRLADNGDIVLRVADLKWDVALPDSLFKKPVVGK